MASPMSQGERRRRSRNRPASLVYVELAAGNGGMLRDLSEEGFAVRAMMPLSAGDRTTFQFALSQSVRIEGEGEILWVAENGRLAGVQFTQVSPAARGEIQEWLRRPDIPPSREEAVENSKQVANPTLEELRAEIQTVPARPEKTTPSETQRPEAQPEAVVEPDDPVPFGEPAESPAAEEATLAANLRETDAGPPEQPRLQLPPAPALPRLALTPGADPRFQSSPAAAQVSEVSGEEAVSPSVWPDLPSRQDAEMGLPGVERNLPEISSILIQPSGSAGRRTAHTLGVASAPRRDREAASSASWTERISLRNAVTVMVILTLAAGTYVFHRSVGQGLIWLGEAMGGVQRPPPMGSSVPHSKAATAAAPTAAATSPSSAEQPSTARTNGSEGAPSAATLVGNSATPLGNTATNPLSPGAPLGGLPPSASAGTEPGQGEYLQAMQILEAKPARDDSSEALRLLWLSVEKGNPSAELALSEMYWRGRGVARNCEQTRILLTAAARKGSREAQKRLEQFQREGCE